MDSGILGLPTFALPADTVFAALLWLAPFDLQHPWYVVTRRFRALSHHHLNCRQIDMF